MMCGLGTKRIFVHNIHKIGCVLTTRPKLTPLEQVERYMHITNIHIPKSTKRTIIHKRQKKKKHQLCTPPRPLTLLHLNNRLVVTNPHLSCINSSLSTPQPYRILQKYTTIGVFLENPTHPLTFSKSQLTTYTHTSSVRSHH